MERQAYYFARIEVAVEGLRAGVKHPALHELLDIVDEARYCLEEELTPLSDKRAGAPPKVPAARRSRGPRPVAEGRQLLGGNAAAGRPKPRGRTVLRARNRNARGAP